MIYTGSLLHQELYLILNKTTDNSLNQTQSLQKDTIKSIDLEP